MAKCCVNIMMLLGLAGTGLGKADKPNIVMIMVDDWGFNNIGFRDTTGETHTPNMDAMVENGLLLNNSYSFFCWSYLHPEQGGVGIPRNMTTLPAYMKQAGYKTHQVGKWDAGMATPTQTPSGRGFDTSLGYFNHDNDCFGYNITDQALAEFPLECKSAEHPGGLIDAWDTSGPAVIRKGYYEEYFFQDRLLDIIHNHNADDPLFLYYASRVAHAPLQAPYHYLQRLAHVDDPVRRAYAAMVWALDDVIGNVTQALKDTGLWDNTLIVVHSDNGGPIYQCPDLNTSICGGANNYPLRGGKTSVFQGGIRVTSFLSGGYLPPSRRGAVEDGMVLVTDFMATFCHLAGVDCSHDPVAKAANLPDIDSVNLWPLLSGENATSARTEYPITVKNSNMLIQWPYKLIRGSAITFPQWTGPSYPNMTTPNGGFLPDDLDCSQGCLFDLQADPTEHHDIAQAHPDVVARMQDRLDYWVKDTFDHQIGHVYRKACEAYIDRYHGYFGPFIDV
eukprot:TRINITY_DN10995_c0_g1_i1.p1 TRINITY_DN10995_c0_g1~~TRINITY_DN10995_c0_g1_i1.p1  ORF type:complete len:504 (+),score=85.75 TRINITY_DN10995_c0_g1_i1:70-1581(+)